MAWPTEWTPDVQQAPGVTQMTPTPAPTKAPAKPNQEPFVGPMKPVQAPAPQVTPMGPELPKTTPLKVAEAPKQKSEPMDDHPLLETVEGDWKGSFSSARALRQAMEEARKQGIKVNIASAFRTRAEQEYLYKTKPAGIAAPPGYSNHERGIAYDLSGDLDKFEKIVERYGFARPLGHEPWHFTYQPEAKGGERVWKDDDPRLQSGKTKQFSPASYQRLAASLGQQHGFSNSDISVMMRQLQQESGFDPKAKSPAGAIGIPQFMPGTVAPLLNKRQLTSDAYLQNGSLQLDLYFEHMGNVLAQNGGNWPRALAAYNSGQGGLQEQIKQGHLYDETRNYVARILRVTPQEAEQLVLSGKGPSVGPINKDAQRINARLSWQEQAKTSMMLMGSGGALRVDPTSGSQSPLSLIAQGTAIKQEETGKSVAQVVQKDLAERVVKPVVRGLTMGLIPIAEFMGGDQNPVGPLMDVNPASAQLRKGLKDATPLLHWMSEVTKADHDWLAPEQQQLDTWRGGKDAFGHVGAIATGKGKIDKDSILANALSAGQELPAMAGAIVAFEFLGPKAMIQSLPAKMAGRATAAIATPVAKGVAGFADAAATGMGMDLAGYLGAKAPQLVQQLGPEFFHEMGAMMTAFSAQSTAQGFGEALQNGATPRDAVIEGIKAGVTGALFGGAFHLGVPVAGQVFKALKGGAIDVADQAAKQVGNTALPMLQRLMEQVKDPKNPFNQQLQTHVLSFVDGLDKMLGKEWTNRAYAQMLEHSRNFREQWARQTQERIGGYMSGLSQKIWTARQGYHQWLQGQQARAQQLLQEKQLVEGMKQSWEQANAVMLADPKFQQALTIFHTEMQAQQAAAEAGKPLVGLSPVAQAAIKELKAPPDMMQQLGIYLQMLGQLENQTRALQGLEELLNPLTPELLAADDEMWEAISRNLTSIGTYVRETPHDLKMDLPAQLQQQLQTANEASPLGILDEMQAQYADGIKATLANGGLSTAVPQRLAKQVEMMAQTLMELAPDKGPIQRMQSAIAQINERKGELRSIIDAPPPKEPSAVNVHASNKHLSQQYLDADAAYKKEVARQNAAKAAAQQELNILQQQKEMLQQVTSMMGGESIPERIRMAMARDMELDFQKSLATNNINEKAFSRLYNAVLGNDERSFMEPDKAWETYKRDFGNRIDIKQAKDAARVGKRALKKAPPEVQKAAQFLQDLRSKAAAEWEYLNALYQQEQAAGISLQADPNAPMLENPGEKKNFVAKYVRANQLTDPNSPFIPHRVKQEFQAAKDQNDPFIRALVPKEWITSQSGRAQRTEGLDLSREFAQPDGQSNVRGYRKSGQGPMDRAVLVGDDLNDPQALEVLDGRSRMEVLKKEGRDYVRIYGRQSVLNNVLADRFGAVHDIISSTSGESPIGSLRTTFMEDAKNAFLRLSYDEARKATANELARYATDVDKMLAPSKASMDQVRTKMFIDQLDQEQTVTLPPTKWEQRMGANLQVALEQNQMLKASLADWIQNKTPSSLREALAQTYGAFQNMAHLDNTNVQLVEQTIGEMTKEFDRMLKAGDIPIEGLGDYKKTGRLPDKFQGEFADAVDSLQSDGAQMQSFLRKYPGMRKVLGATFDMMRILEEYQVASPELAGAFRLAYWPLRFPELKRTQMRNKGAGEFSGSWLENEQIRKIQSFKHAKELHTAARSKLLGGKWDLFSRVIDGKESGVPPTPEGKIQRFLGMSPEEQTMLLGPMEPRELKEFVTHLGLRNPIRDPIQTMRLHLQAILRADLVRDAVKNMANIPIPGTGLNFVHRIKFQGSEQPGVVAQKRAASVPVVKTMNIGEVANESNAAQLGVAPGERAAPMVPLSSVFGVKGNITFAGEAVPTSELFAHPEVAHLLDRYFSRGKFEPTGWMQFHEISRSAQLMGVGINYLGRLLANHSAGLTTLGLRNLWKGSLSEGTQQILDGVFSPVALTRMGREARQDAVLFRRAQLAGLSQDGVDNLAKAVVGRLEQELKQTKPNFGQRVVQHQENIHDAWDNVRLAEGMKVTTADLANTGLTAFRALERAGLHAPIQDAALGAWVYHTNVIYEGGFKPLVESGVLTKDAAIRMAEQQAAELVNRWSGTMQSYLSTSSFRNAVGNTALGLLEITPGVLRSEIHNIANAISDEWGHQALRGLQPAQEYMKQRSRDTIMGLLIGGFTSLQVKSFLLNGHGTVHNDPSDPTAAFKVRVGDKLWDDGTMGTTNRFLRAMVQTTVGRQGVGGLTRILKNQVQGPVAAIWELSDNRDRMGNPIMVTNDPGPLNMKNHARAAQYLLSRAINLEQFVGSKEHYQNPGERVAGMLGMSGTSVASAASIASRTKGDLAQEDRDRLHRMHYWEEQLVQTQGQQQQQALEEMAKVAFSGPHPWDGEKFARHLSLVLHRSTGKEDRLGAVLDEMKKVPKRAREDYLETARKWLQNEQGK